MSWEMRVLGRMPRPWPLCRRKGEKKSLCGADSIGMLWNASGSRCPCLFLMTIYMLSSRFMEPKLRCTSLLHVFSACFLCLNVGRCWKLARLPQDGMAGSDFRKLPAAAWTKIHARFEAHHVQFCWRVCFPTADCPSLHNRHHHQHQETSPKHHH